MPRYETARYDPPAPVAIVTVRPIGGGPDVDDVELLIDTGADVSLIPRSAVERLGVRPDPAAVYELIGFRHGRTNRTADAQ